VDDVSPTYSPVGATRAMLHENASPPTGYRVLRSRFRIDSASFSRTSPSPGSSDASGSSGAGPSFASLGALGSGYSFEALGDALLTWRLHKAAGTRPLTSSPRVVPGAVVTTRVPLRAPCVVVWVIRNGRHIGFGYGTLPGHPFAGEEAFELSIGPDGAIWFTVTAFSRPARWFTRLGGPAAPLLQHAYARHLARTLRRLR
jgi:uncharacterized protein (UPF0548 family)